MLSSTLGIPSSSGVPRHIAVIMDGNGRWAKRRFLPRVAGHKRGVDSLRKTVSTCMDLGVEYLTVFAFSSENWRRPQEEVSFLMQLFYSALEAEVEKFHKNNIRFKVIGDLSPFDSVLQDLIQRAEALTSANTGLTLTVAANYGGRWDVLQAMNSWRRDNSHAAEFTELTEAELLPYLSMAYAPEPDLFIRTGGEQRISNFLLWQLAYTELYFTDVLWPEFDADELKKAVTSYAERERRFGRISEQLTKSK